MGKGLAFGFFGCLGMIAAPIVILVVLMFAGAMSSNARSDRFQSGTASAADLKNMCATAYVSAKHLAPRALAGSDLNIDDPEILSGGARPTIACGFTDRRGRSGSVSATVTCMDPLSDGCVHIVAIKAGDRYVFSGG
jgi:hypothetical protein